MDQKRQNFKRISENRVSKILVILQQLQNLTNTSFYDYSEEDIQKLFKEIEAETRKAKKVLLDAKKKGRTFIL